MLKFDKVSSCGGQIPFFYLPLVFLLYADMHVLTIHYLSPFRLLNFLISLALQAIVSYELAFHFNPHCAEACNNLGVIYKDQDNLDKAVECYQVSLLLSLVIHLIFSFSYVTSITLTL